eukprot:Hpha_TRINITY_DN16304_c4_g14::TRINITY_DN16304_c4_g14_i1::g.59258::m.59258
MLGKLKKKFGGGGGKPAVGGGGAAGAPSPKAAADPSAVFVSHVLRHGVSEVRLVDSDLTLGLLAVVTPHGITVFGAHWAKQRVELERVDDIISIRFLNGAGVLGLLTPDAMHTYDVRRRVLETHRESVLKCVAPLSSENIFLVGSEGGMIMALTAGAEPTRLRVDIRKVTGCAGDMDGGDASVQFIVARPSHPQVAIAATKSTGIVQVLMPRGELTARFTVPGGAEFVDGTMCPRDKWLVAVATDGRILVWKATQDPDEKHGKAVPCYAQLPSPAPVAVRLAAATLSPESERDENSFSLTWYTVDEDPGEPEQHEGAGLRRSKPCVFGKVMQGVLRPKEKQLLSAPPLVITEEPGGLAAVVQMPFSGSPPGLLVAPRSDARKPRMGQQRGREWKWTPFSPFRLPSQPAQLLIVPESRFLGAAAAGASDLGGMGGASPFARNRRARRPVANFLALISGEYELMTHRFSPASDCLCVGADIQTPPAARPSKAHPGRRPDEIISLLGGHAFLRVRGGGAWWQDLAGSPACIVTDDAFMQSHGSYGVRAGALLECECKEGKVEQGYIIHTYTASYCRMKLCAMHPSGEVGEGHFTTPGGQVCLAALRTQDGSVRIVSAQSMPEGELVLSVFERAVVSVPGPSDPTSPASPATPAPSPAPAPAPAPSPAPALAAPRPPPGLAPARAPSAPPG